MKELEFKTPTEFKEWLEKSLYAVRKPDLKWKPKLIRITDLRDSVSRQQQKYLFGYIYKNLLQQHINNGDDNYYGWSVDNSENLDDFDMDMRTLYHSRIRHTAEGFPVVVPKRLKMGKAYKDEVTAYIEKLLKHGAMIGVDLVPPEWSE